MKINYTFKHLDYSEALCNYTRDELTEISRFLLKEGFGNVLISKQNHEFCVEVSVNTREKYFKASAYSPDPYTAVSLVVEKLEKQFLKVAKQFKDHTAPENTKEGRIKNWSKYRKAA